MSRGKVTLASSVVGASILLLVGFTFFEFQVPEARADDVQTSVTVLNTPPTWVGGEEAHESIASATSTPTNAGQVITWLATASDSSGDSYYLLICKTSGAPTANAGAAPTCNGGVGNQWAVSTSAVASGVQASAATTTRDTFPFNNEKNDWFGWVCDGNTSLPRCYSVYATGNGVEDTSSPFVVNHVPVFAAISNDGPENPGGSVIWTPTSYDNDSLGGSQDQVQLYVCRALGFSTSTGCTGAGGGWATSTLATSNPTATAVLTDPMRDGTYAAYVYIVDNHGLVATSTFQAFNSSYVVNNMTPTISAATVSIDDTDDSGNLTLTTPNGLTTGFKVRFTVTDSNSCQNITSGNELTAARANIYRSGVGSASCQNASGHYSSNSCYPNASPLFSPHISCVQDTAGPDTCTGATDSTVRWTCTFSLWYNTDPTDGSSSADTQYFDQNWLASVDIIDDDFATSTLTEGSTGNDVGSFLAFDVPQSGIAYPSLEPGQQTSPLSPTTSLLAYGNIGLDEDLYGDTMCRTTEWTGPDSCDTNGVNPANDVPISNQKAATSSVAFSSSAAVTLAGSTTPSDLLIRIPKTTSTSSPQSGLTYWGINIPSAITTAGDYEGQNTITAKKSNPSFW